MIVAPKATIAMILLNDALDALERAESMEGVQHVVRSTARRLVKAHGATLVLLDHGQCFYADEDAASPLWKGQRFPVDHCISGWAMLHRQSVVIPDIRIDDRIPQAAYRPTFVRSLVMVPIRADDPVGAIGTYWARCHHAADDEIEHLTALAEATGQALERFMRPLGGAVGAAYSPEGPRW